MIKKFFLTIETNLSTNLFLKYIRNNIYIYTKHLKYIVYMYIRHIMILRFKISWSLDCKRWHSNIESPSDPGVPWSSENVSLQYSQYNGIANSCRIYALYISLSSYLLRPLFHLIKNKKNNFILNFHKKNSNIYVYEICWWLFFDLD